MPEQGSPSPKESTERSCSRWCGSLSSHPSLWLVHLLKEAFKGRETIAMVVLLTAFQVSPLMCSCAAPGSSHPGSAPECLLAGLEAKRAGLRMRLPKGF